MKINPFYKFVVIASVATGLTFVHSFRTNLIILVITLILFIMGTKPKTWFKAFKIFLPLSVLGFSIFMSGFLWGDGAGSVAVSSTQTGLNMLARFFSFAGLGLLITLTTHTHELIKAMQKNGKLPRKFAYGLLAALNLVPQMKTEYQNAKLAFMVRGAKIGPLSTKVLFAMLVNCFRWSETLAIAMHSKGFYEANKKELTTK